MGNRSVYVCWIGEGAEKEVEYVTISALWKVWKTLKANKKSVWLNGWGLWRNGSEEWADTSYNN